MLLNKRSLNYVAYIETPIGFLRIRSNGNAIIEIMFIDTNGLENGDRHTGSAVTQLREYFEGSRTQFQLPIEFKGTEFERSVWNELKNIPYGATKNYAEIASKLSDKTVAIAVGAANAKNPMAVVVPCHRVIGANRNLSGYAGGLHRKEWLLRHEGALLL